jgi:hypothetical protein
MPHHRFQKLVVITSLHNLENQMHHLSVLLLVHRESQNWLLMGDLIGLCISRTYVVHILLEDNEAKYHI